MISAKKFAKSAKTIATKYKTLYVMGSFGSPLTSSNKYRYTNNHPYNKTPDRVRLIKNADSNTFAFDCVGLIKGILWGFNGNKKKPYGGAVYASAGVPDIDADTMINRCRSVSKSFGSVAVGEVLWTDGHIGIYIGKGLAVECTPSFKNKVQITAVGNMGSKSGYYTRKWKKHGRLPYVKYESTAVSAVKSIVNKVTKKDTSDTFKIGDKVVVNGKIYYSAAGGINIKKKKEKMYVVDIVSKSAYKYFIGVAAKKGGVRQGWGSPAEIKKL